MTEVGHNVHELALEVAKLLNAELPNVSYSLPGYIHSAIDGQLILVVAVNVIDSQKWTASALLVLLVVSVVANMNVEVLQQIFFLIA